MTLTLTQLYDYQGACPVCPKCGHDDIEVKLISAKRAFILDRPPVEHLNQKCLLCGYVWFERTADDPICGECSELRIEEIRRVQNKYSFGSAVDIGI